MKKCCTALLITISFNFITTDIIKAQDTLLNDDENFKTPISLIEESTKALNGQKIRYKNFMYGSYDPLNAIKGQIPGLSISKKGGDPSVLPDVHIRGVSSIYLDNAPLYIVDGMPVHSTDFLSIDNIGSFSIYNNISSTAFFGYQGGNGAIVVNSKEPTKDRPINIQINKYFAVNSPTKKLDLLTAEEYRDYALEEYLKEKNHNPDLEYEDFFHDGGASTDWQEEISRKGYTNVTGITVDGTIHNTSYKAHLSTKNQDGTIIETGDKQINTSLMLSQNVINNKLNLTGHINYFEKSSDFVHTGGFNKENALYHTYTANPTDPVMNDNGNFILPDRVYRYSNPLAIAKLIENKRESSGFLGTFGAEYAITDHVNFSVFGGNKVHNKETFHFRPENDNGLYSYTDYKKTTKDQRATLLGRAILDAKKTFFKKHNLHFMMGNEYQVSNYKDYLREANPDTVFTIDEVDINDNKVHSYFASLAYNYNQKYFIYGGIRYDQLEHPIEEVEESYPSLSVAWNAKNEAFLRDLNIISTLSLDAGIGKAGNLSFLPDYIFLENLEELNYGMNLGFFKDRILGNIRFYEKENKDLSIQLPVKKPFPYQNEYRIEKHSIGKYSRKGFEWMLSFDIFKNSHFKWQSNISFNKSKSKIKANEDEHNVYLNYYSFGYITGKDFIDDAYYTHRLMDGQDIGSFYLPVHATIMEDGTIIYKSKLNDGECTSEIFNAKRKAQGNAFPSHEIGLHNKWVFFNRVFVNLHIRGVRGHSIYNATRMFMSDKSLFPQLNLLKKEFQKYRGYPYYHPKLSSIFLEDASFYKIDNLTIGYRTGFDNFKWLQNLELYFGINNLLTITDYTGADPEVNYDHDLLGIENFSTYPSVTSYFMGAKLGL